MFFTRRVPCGHGTLSQSCAGLLASQRMLDQQPGGLPARYPAHVPCWAQEVLQTPSCLYDRALSCSTVPAWWAARWPEEQRAGRAAGQQTSDSNPPPPGAGLEVGRPFRVGASCCHEALCLLTGRSVGQGLPLESWQGRLSAALLPGCRLAWRGGRRVEGCLVLCPPSWSSHSSPGGQSWEIIENTGVLLPGVS